MSSKNRTPNDDRSDSLNPNNPAHKAAQDNRSVQLNQPPPAPPPERSEEVEAPPVPPPAKAGEKGATTTKR